MLYHSANQGDDLIPDASLKTELFSRIHQLDRLNHELERIMILPKKSRLEWIEKHSQYLNDMMDTWAEESELVLESLDGDRQTMALSVEYVANLRNVMNVMHNIFYGAR